MSIETVLTEMTALRNELKSLTKIVRKIKAKQDDPTGEKSANRAKNNGEAPPLPGSPGRQARLAQYRHPFYQRVREG